MLRLCEKAHNLLTVGLFNLDTTDIFGLNNSLIWGMSCVLYMFSSITYLFLPGVSITLFQVQT